MTLGQDQNLSGAAQETFDALDAFGALNQDIVGETKDLRVRNYESFFNHFFAVIPEDEGITSLRFITSETDGSVSRSGPDARVHAQSKGTASVSIKTNEHVNYTPGSGGLGGIAVELPNGLPTAEQDAHFGLTNDTDGYGAGIKRFDRREGVPPVTEKGVQPYTFIDIAGTRTRVPQEHWNLDTLDGSGDANNPSGLQLDNFEQGNIIRFPFLWYGHGALLVRIGVYTDTDVKFVDTHAFIPPDHGMPEQPNVPIQAHIENNGTARTLDVDVRALHFERLTGEADFRVNGERRAGQDVDTAWEPLLSWEQRTGWDAVNIRPIAVVVASDTDLALDIQLDTSLNGASFGAPTHTTSSERAVDVDTSATGFSSTGERRWAGQVTGGQGGQKEQGVGDLSFELPATQTATLAAKADASNATVESTVVWGSEF